MTEKKQEVIYFTNPSSTEDDYLRECFMNASEKSEEKYIFKTPNGEYVDTRIRDMVEKERASKFDEFMTNQAIERLHAEQEAHAQKLANASYSIKAYDNKGTELESTNDPRKKNVIHIANPPSQGAVNVVSYYGYHSLRSNVNFNGAEYRGTYVHVETKSERKERERTKNRKPGQNYLDLRKKRF